MDEARGSSVGEVDASGDGSTCASAGVEVMVNPPALVMDGM
jgi:hypothetical protein